ncbi:hypothetical protein [Halosegnis marinus]|uniref:hypothetical protein n=1 Tax=Halosegnis marinus TaxID=3034023 RepID=UPI00360B99EC
MAECVVCGESVPVSDACRHCARPVCDDHREPPAHDCPGVESDSRVWYTDPDAGRDGRTGGRELSNPRRLAAGVAVAVLVALVVGESSPPGARPRWTASTTNGWRRSSSRRSTTRGPPVATRPSNRTPRWPRSRTHTARTWPRATT